MCIKIEKLTESEFKRKGIYDWPIWEKETSTFEWTYDEKEQFYLLEGKIRIRTKDSEYEVQPGDFVTCPKGLDCEWDVEEYVKKHYHFIES